MSRVEPFMTVEQREHVPSKSPYRFSFVNSSVFISRLLGKLPLREGGMFSLRLTGLAGTKKEARVSAWQRSAPGACRRTCLPIDSVSLKLNSDSKTPVRQTLAVNNASQSS
jgi:hypothetical protein